MSTRARGRAVRSQAPDILKVDEDLASLEPAKVISMATLIADVASLERGLRVVDALVKRVATGASDDAVGRTLAAFRARAGAAAAEVAAGLAAARAGFAEAGAYLGEKDAAEPCDLFAPLSAFIASLAAESRASTERAAREAAKVARELERSKRGGAAAAAAVAEPEEAAASPGSVQAAASPGSVQAELTVRTHVATRSHAAARVMSGRIMHRRYCLRSGARGCDSCAFGRRA